MRWGVIVVVTLLAGSATAQEGGRCAGLWAGLTGWVPVTTPVTGRLGTGPEGTCEVLDIAIDLPESSSPDIRADRLRLSGSALGWLQDPATPPERLELAIEGLRFVVQTGDAQLDYLMAAQAQAAPIAAAALLTWSPDSRTLAVERFEIDFPGANRFSLTLRAKGVDLSSTGAAQMSLASFAVTEMGLAVQSHGLFEGYLLLALGSFLLPLEGDMQAAEARLKAQAAAGIAGLPTAVLGEDSKAALLALVEELPNPSGTLTLTLRSEAGIGPSRLTSYVIRGLPESVADVVPLFDGVVMAAGWTHEKTP